MRAFKDKPLFYVSLVLSVFLIFQVASLVRAAFTEPTNSFPGSAPAAPLDTSSLDQTKAGGLVVNGASGLGVGGTPIGVRFYVNGPVQATGPGTFGSLLVNGTGDYGTIQIGSPADFEFSGGDDSIFYFTNTGDVSSGETSFRNASNAKLLTILSNGNVGIGTSGPGDKLHVEGFLRVNNRLRLVTATNWWNIDNDTGLLRIFRENTDGSGGAVRMVIQDGGNVGIGTTKPTANLEVIGKASSTEVCISGDCKTAWPSGGTPSQWTNISGGGIYYDGGKVGIGNTNPSSLLDISDYFSFGTVQQTVFGFTTTFSQLDIKAPTGVGLAAPRIHFQIPNAADAYLSMDGSGVYVTSGSGIAGFTSAGGVRLNIANSVLSTLGQCDASERGMLVFVPRKTNFFYNSATASQSNWDELYLCRLKDDGSTYEWKKLTG